MTVIIKAKIALKMMMKYHKIAKLLQVLNRISALKQMNKRTKVFQENEKIAAISHWAADGDAQISRVQC